MKKTILGLSAFVFTILHMVSAPATAHAQDVYLSEIRWFATTFCPRGFAEASGQILSISQNTALFALLGTTYGGNGTTTFALPDLRGRTMIHSGQGNGLSSQTQGQTGGHESITLSISQMPPHSHSLNAAVQNASKVSPEGSLLAQSGTYRSAGGPTTSLNSSSIGASGGGQPVNIMPPYLALRACIAIEGIFPSRN